jgi:hypothetical protein
MAVEKLKLGSQTTLLTTELDGLASGNTALSAAFDNTQGQAGDGYTLGDLELVWAYGTGPTLGAVSVWLLGSQDGTNYEDGTAGTPGTTPGRPPDVVFPPIYSSTAKQIQVQRLALPGGKFKVLVKNDGTSQAFSANNTPAGVTKSLKLRPITREYV